MVVIKTSEELDLMRESGKILHEILYTLADKSAPGVNLLELDELAGQLIATYDNATCTFKGFRGFPGNICTCLNDEIVHGIPRDQNIRDGDVLSIDMGVTYKGMITDSALTFPVGNVREESKTMINMTKETLQAAIKKIQAGTYVGDIGHFIQKQMEGAGYSIVRELTGHGVGKDLWEDPHVPNFGEKGTGMQLRTGMTLAIEPIVSMGKGEMVTDPDGWTIRTKDGSLSCQAEHTIIIHDDHAEIVT